MLCILFLSSGDSGIGNLHFSYKKRTNETNCDIVLCIFVFCFCFVSTLRNLFFFCFIFVLFRFILFVFFQGKMQIWDSGVSREKNKANAKHRGAICFFISLCIVYFFWEGVVYFCLCFLFFIVNKSMLSFLMNDFFWRFESIDCQSSRFM